MNEPAGVHVVRQSPGGPTWMDFMSDGTVEVYCCNDACMVMCQLHHVGSYPNEAQAQAAARFHRNADRRDREQAESECCPTCHRPYNRR